MKTITLQGGPADGKIIECDDYATKIMYPEIIPQESKWYAENEPLPEFEELHKAPLYGAAIYTIKGNIGVCEP